MPNVRSADRIDLDLDRRLVRVAIWTALLGAVPAAAAGWAAAGPAGSLGALWAVGAVGLNGVLSAAVSWWGGLSRRQIGVGLVLAALPVRLLILAAALVVGVGPLGLPVLPVAVTVMVAEGCVVAAQSWLVARGTT
ncbi:MAG TPA: hypothetical protein VNA14_05235, partial [Mycobacteriales bacterium]|nr:hypothetical protein [Mycobacteriales bacterium]